MADNKKKFPTFNSPRGTLKYTALTKPDYGTKEYPCPEGRYKAGLVLRASDPETKAFLAKLTPLYDAALAEAEEKFKALKVESRKKLKEVQPNPLYTTLYDKETEEPTGYIEFRFKMDASGVADKDTEKERKWTAKPGVFDAKGHPIVGDIEIWGGSIGKIAFEARPYFVSGTAAAGLSLKLKAAQIIKLHQGSDRSAADYGFSEEDGYEFEGVSDGARDAGFTAEETSTDTDEPSEF